MASSDLVKKVIQLKLQLTDTSKCTTLLKTLQKLQDLDVSLDVLSETGIGKTVNSLRKHKEVGEAAKTLVRYWKKLVPKDSISNPVDSDTPQTAHLKAGFEEKVHTSIGGTDQNGDCLQSQGESQESPATAKGSKKVDNKRPASPQDQEGERHGPEGPSGSSLERDAPQIPQDECRLFQKEDVNKPPKKNSQEDVNNNSVTLKKKSKHAVHCDAVPGSRSSSRDSKGRRTPTEKAHGVPRTEKPCEDKDPNPKRPQHPLPPKAEAKYSKTLLHSALEQEEDGAAALMSSWVSGGKKKKVEEKPGVKMKKNSGSDGRQRNAGNKKAKSKQNNSSEADLEGASMSFESYLSYDTNALKRKVRSAPKQPPKKQPKTLEKGDAPKQPEVKPLKWPSLLDNGIHVNKVKGNVLDLLNTPLPEFLPECDKFSTVDYHEPKRAEKESCDEPEETLFTGQRLNRKMQVYSGTKASFLPSMMSLHQQCIRTLQNNIDMLYDTGGVPFEILEPVLERCTPDQLLRIEDWNPSYMGVSDHLWGRHCQRDFRGAKLLEYESWKEMHLRLSQERENKFKRLAKTIVSAHSKKPQGRQVKMAFIHTVAKPPRDVRIQQEIYGTAGALQPSVVRASVKIQEHRARPSCLEAPQPAPTSSAMANSQEARKRTRVAPMMAKSLKAFKKQQGRR